MNVQEAQGIGLPSFSPLYVREEGFKGTQNLALEPSHGRITLWLNRSP